MNAIRFFSYSKMAVADFIPGEIHRRGGSLLLQNMNKIFWLIGEEEVIPQEIKYVSIVHLYKETELENFHYLK